jgi:two-component system, response regulator
VSKSGRNLKEINDHWLARHQSAGSSFPVLIADDSEADIFFLLRAFESAGVQNPIFVTRSGHDTMGFLKGERPFNNRELFPQPRIVFLDLYMPGINGFDILRWKQFQPEYARTLFVALSNSSRIKDISTAYDLGANTFLSKPMDSTEVVNLLEAYRNFWTLVATKTKPKPV